MPIGEPQPWTYPAPSVSTYTVRVVPELGDFGEQVRAAVTEALADVQVGVTTTEVEEFEYDVEGRVVKRTRTVAIGGDV